MPNEKSQAPLYPNTENHLPQPIEPNQQVYTKLLEPLKTSLSGKKYLLCITDAFTKYV